MNSHKNARGSLLYRRIVYLVIVICCTSLTYCHSDIMTIRHFLQFHEVVSVVSASRSASFMSPILLYCLYDHNSHNISFSPIPSTMARSKRPLPTTRGLAYRIVRASHARLADTNIVFTWKYKCGHLIINRCSSFEEHWIERIFIQTVASSHFKPDNLAVYEIVLIELYKTEFYMESHKMKGYMNSYKFNRCTKAYKLIRTKVGM